MPELVFISHDLPINDIFAKWRQEKRKLKITGIARQTVSILKSTCHALSADKTHMFGLITVWNKLSIFEKYKWKISIGDKKSRKFENRKTDWNIITVMRRKRRKFPEKIAEYEEYSCNTIIFRIFKLLFVKLLLLLQKTKIDWTYKLCKNTAVLLKLMPKSAKNQEKTPVFKTKWKSA